MDSSIYYDETEVARAATVVGDACQVADDGGVQIQPGGHRPAEVAEGATTTVDENGNEVVTMTYEELSDKLLQAYEDGFQKGEAYGYECGVAYKQANASEEQECDDEDDDENEDEEEAGDGDDDEAEADEEYGEAEADGYEEGEEVSAEAKGKTFFADEFENEAKDEDCDEGGEAEAEGYDEGGEAEAEGYDEGGEAEAEDHEEAGSKDEKDEKSKKSEKDAAATLALAQAMAMASAQKRKVLCELGDYLEWMVAEQQQNSDDGAEQHQQQPAAVSQVAYRYLASDQECPAGRALHRLNRLRLRHSGCRPLARSDASSVYATHLAEDYASREEMFGVMPEDLQEEIDASSVAVHNYEARGRQWQCGIAVYRSTAPADRDLQALALASIDHWYNGCESFDFANRQDSMGQTHCRQFAQLIDTNSRRMGWGGAVLGRYAYAVAIFDNPIVQDDEAVEKLSPPIPGVDHN